MGVRNAARRSPRIGIFGGTFDPIHFGHLAIARTAAAAVRLDKVIFVPSGEPYLRAVPKASAEVRMEMVQAAIQDDPRFTISRVDVDRPGLSYTVDTIADLRVLLPRESELFFILGADILPELAQWKDSERLLQAVTLVCVGRPGGDQPKDLLVDHPGKRALYVEGPMLETSATEIRSRVARGLPVENLVPAAVLNIIHANRLYEEDESDDRGLK